LDEDWPAYLEANGYVVIKQVADQSCVDTARDLFWNYFQDADGVDRNDSSTWKSWRVDHRGIVTDAEVIQSAGAWYVRGLPKVKQVFSVLWNTTDLIVSMDSLLLWKPWWIESSWRPKTEGLHMDQNPFQKPNRDCVQGMVSLYDVTTVTGGLEVVPKSHLPEAHAGLKQRHPFWNGRGDFCVLDRYDILSKPTKLLTAQAGDLILWDSRTLHGGLVGTGEVTPETPSQIARMSQTVCMLPRDRATANVLAKRKVGFTNGHGFTHWPNEIRITSQARASYKPIELTPEQALLL